MYNIVTLMFAHHSITNETTWDKPLAKVTAPKPPPAAVSAAFRNVAPVPEFKVCINTKNTGDQQSVTCVLTVRPSDATSVCQGENPIVFFDIRLGNKEAGRIEMEVWEDKVPKTAQNFVAL